MRTGPEELDAAIAVICKHESLWARVVTPRSRCELQCTGSAGAPTAPPDSGPPDVLPHSRVRPCRHLAAGRTCPDEDIPASSSPLRPALHAPAPGAGSSALPVSSGATGLPDAEG